MPIDIYQIKELFWDNNSYEVPNVIPTVFEDKLEGLNRRPTINDYYSGTIKLTGGHWNWCRYGNYWYFLKKTKPLHKHEDIKKQVWLYTLVKCMWCNYVLSNIVHVKGDLACWNLDKDLKKHINKCTWWIEKPANLYRIPFKETKKLSIDIFPLPNISQPVYSSKRWTTNYELRRSLKGFKIASKYLYPRRKEIFIFSFLNGDINKNGWKQKIVELVNEDLKKIKENFENRKVINVSTPSTANRLLNHIGLSFDTDSIGQIDNSKHIKKIDLSKVTDIVRINWNDLQEITPKNPLNFDTGIFSGSDIITQTDEEQAQKFAWKLSRRFYAPLGNRNNGDYYFSGQSSYGSEMKRKGWWNSIRGQEITYKDGYYERTGYFYWVDKVDFYLNWYNSSLNLWKSSLVNWVGKWFPWIRNQYGDLQGALDNDPLVTYLLGNYKSSVSGYSPPFSGVVSWGLSLTYNIFPHYPTLETNLDKQAALWYRFPNEKIPGYGVLIWQTERHYPDWNRVEYKGSNPIKEILWYSGIDKDGFLSEYERRDKWWSRIELTGKGELARLCKDTKISKFFLDLDYMLWVYFAPRICCYDGSSNYQSASYYSDNFGFFDVVKEEDSSNWDATAIGSKWKIKHEGKEITPPFTEQLYAEQYLTRNGKIQNALIKSKLDLSQDISDDQDFTIEKGDFFISSLEYYWRKYSTGIWKDNEDFYTSLKEDNFVIGSNVLDDFTGLQWPQNVNWRNDVDSGEFKNKLHWENYNKEKIFCICSNLEGNLELRELRYGSYSHELSRTERQALLRVDGRTNIDVTYYLLKKPKEKIDFNLEDEKSDTSFDVLTTFYKANGYKVIVRKDGDSKKAYWNWLTEEDLKDPNGNLFDLVGSNWYVYIRNNKVHYIYKHGEANPEEIIGKEENVLTLDTDWIPDSLKNASLTAKINQINIIYWKNQPNHIKSRFIFKEDEEDAEETNLNVSYKALLTDDKPTSEEHHLFTISGDWDRFEGIISTPKVPNNIQLVADYLNLESLRLRQAQEIERYEIQQQRLGLDQKLIDIAAERAQWDLSIQSITKAIDLSFDIAGLASGGALWATRVGKNAMWNSLSKEFATEPMPGIDTWSKAMKQGFLPIDPAAFKTTRWQMGEKLHSAGAMLRKAGAKGSFNPLGAIHGIADSALWFAFQRPEKVRRIKEDKELSSKSLVLKSMDFDRHHFYELQDQALRINNLANQFFKEGVNNSLLYEKWKKEKLKRTKTTFTGTTKKEEEEVFKTDLYLLTLIPSERQLEYIEDFRKHHGVHCDIPNQVITLRNEMEPNIIQLRNIDEQGIEGISDLVARSWLKAKLLNKIKIIENEGESARYSYFDYKLIPPILVDSIQCTLKIEELEKEIEKHQETKTFDNKTLEAIKKIIGSLEANKGDKDELAKDLVSLKEWKAEIEAYNVSEQVTQLNKPSYSPVILNLANDLISILEKQVAENQEKERLETKITDLTTEVVNTSDKLEKEKAKSKELEDRKTQLEELNKQLNTSIKLLREEINKQQTKLTQKNNALNECNTAKRNLQTQITKKDKTIKDLTDSKTKLEEDLKTANENKATLQGQLTQKENSLNTCNDDLKTLKEQLETSGKDKEDLKTKIDALEKKKKELETEIEQLKQQITNNNLTSTQCQNSLTETQTKLNECTAEKEKLANQLKDKEKEINDLNSEIEELKTKSTETTQTNTELENLLKKLAKALEKKEWTLEEILKLKNSLPNYLAVRSTLLYIFNKIFSASKVRTAAQQSDFKKYIQEVQTSLSNFLNGYEGDINKAFNKVATETYNYNDEKTPSEKFPVSTRFIKFFEKAIKEYPTKEKILEKYKNILEKIDSYSEVKNEEGDYLGQGTKEFDKKLEENFKNLLNFVKEKNEENLEEWFKKHLSTVENLVYEWKRWTYTYLHNDEEATKALEKFKKRVEIKFKTDEYDKQFLSAPSKIETIYSDLDILWGIIEQGEEEQTDFKRQLEEVHDKIKHAGYDHGGGVEEDLEELIRKYEENINENLELERRLEDCVNLNVLMNEKYKYPESWTPKDFFYFWIYKFNCERNKVVDFLIKHSSLGLTVNEFSKYGLQMQFFAQLYKNVKDLLDDNTSFMPQQNANLRQQIISSPQNNIKKLEVNIFRLFLEFVGYRSNGERIEIAQYNEIRPYGKSYMSYFNTFRYYKSFLERECFLWNMWQRYKWKYSFWDRTYKDLSNEMWNNFKGDNFSFTKKFFTHRYSNGKKFTDFKNTDIDYGYYDVVNGEYPGAFLWETLTYLYKKPITENFLEINAQRPARVFIEENTYYNSATYFSDYWGDKYNYKGFSNKGYYVGYIITLIVALNKMYSYDQTINQNQFFDSISNLAPATLFVFNKLLETTAFIENIKIDLEIDNNVYAKVNDRYIYFRFIEGLEEGEAKNKAEMTN